MKKHLTSVLLLWSSIAYSQDNCSETIPLDYLLFNSRTTLCHFEKNQNPGFITNIDDNEICFGEAYLDDVNFLGYHFFSLPIFGVKTYNRCVRDCHAELILEIEHSKIPTRESYHLVIIIPEDLELSELTIHYKNTLAQKANISPLYKIVLEALQKKFTIKRPM